MWLTSCAEPQAARNLAIRPHSGRLGYLCAVPHTPLQARFPCPLPSEVGGLCGQWGQAAVVVSQRAWVWTKHFNVTTLLARPVPPAACFPPLPVGEPWGWRPVILWEKKHLEFCFVFWNGPGYPEEGRVGDASVHLFSVSLEAQKPETHIKKGVVIHVQWV